MNTNSKEQKTIKQSFDDLFAFDSQQEKWDHDAHMISFRFLSELERVMENEKVNRKDLACKIGTSSSFITQLFRGNKLVNLITLAKFQDACNITFDIKARSKTEARTYQRCLEDFLQETKDLGHTTWVISAEERENKYSTPFPSNKTGGNAETTVESVAAKVA